jgi:hypothetical protein
VKTKYNEQLKDYICYGDGELPRVTAAQPMPDFSLLLAFSSGEKRRYNAAPLLEKKVFKPLANPALFMAAKVSGGTVYWSDDIDLAPEHLYECSTPVRD